MFTSIFMMPTGDGEAYFHDFEVQKQNYDP